MNCSNPEDPFRHHPIMKTILVEQDEVLRGYDVVSVIYPHVPPLSMWRAWEYAAYQHYCLAEPVLDLGCGDGRFFKLIWPGTRHVIGLDHQIDVVRAAKATGVYREACVSEACNLPFSEAQFSSVFANCSLEHMNRLDEVLKSVHRCLRPNGNFLVSVVNERFVKWNPLPLLLEQICGQQIARNLVEEHVSFHNLKLRTTQNWTECLWDAGFEVLEYLPIVPEVTCRFFLTLDHLWHIPCPGRKGELGEKLFEYFIKLRDFRRNFRNVLAGILSMETNRNETGGSVLWCQKRG